MPDREKACGAPLLHIQLSLLLCLFGLANAQPKPMVQVNLGV
jgi:hypothetical protein